MKKLGLGLVILIVAAISFWAGGRFFKERSVSTGVKQGERRILYYSDPMNPGFRSDKPGVAPCGMPLEPVYADTGGDGEGATPQAPGTIRLSAERRQFIGVKVAPVAREPMTYNLRLYGKIVPDETRLFRINASTDSWIRKLSDVTTGSIVSKNQILAEALAPSYYNAQVTYLIALDNMDRIRQQLGGELRHQQGDLADNQIRMAVQALQNLGITDAQVEELANTRKARPYLQVRAPSRGVVLSRNLTLSQWFKAGEEFYTIADIGKVWVYADVYENEARHLRPGMAVKVSHPQFGKSFNARVSRVLPLFDAVSKTLKVRLDVENPHYELRPDMFVDVEIPITMPPSLHVPADAVIDSGTRTTVYVESGNGVFEPCQVETGWRLGRRVEITAGLMPGDKVVVSGNFLIDSESRMKAAGSAADTGFADQSERHAGIDMPAMAEHDPSAMPDVDPVCRMYVNEKEARKAGRTARVAGKTYYFCSRECLDTFSGNPGKYVSGNRAVRKGEEQLAGPGLDRGLAAMPEARKARNSRSEGGSGKEDSKDAYGRAPTTPGIVDWGGPAKGTDTSAKRDWGSWGRFPGAEYLGLKEKTKDKTGRRSETAGTVQGKPAEDECAGHSHDDDTGKPDAAHGGAAPGASGGQADQ